jgi:hypothetical protein
MLSKAKKIIRVLLRRAGLEIRRLPSINLLKSSYSNLDEEAIIRSHLDELLIENGCCVDIGASDGVTMSNSLSLYKNGWNGLAVECNPNKFSSLAAIYIDFPNVNLAKCMVTPTNVLALLAAFNIPKEFEVLTLDIDGYDYFVLEQILFMYRPTLICTEINEKIPPPVKFTVKWRPEYAWNGRDHFYGQSISQLHMLCIRHKYALVELHYNNAFLISLERSPKPSLSAEQAYQSGYMNKLDRKNKFPWNYNVEDLLHMQPEEAMAYINTLFDKYKGMFDLSI